MQTDWEETDLEGMVGMGMTYNQIAHETDTTYSAVRAGCYRRGLKPKRETQVSHKDRIQDMKAMSAIEYLLDCIELLERSHKTHSNTLKGLGLTKHECRIVECLMSAEGKIRTKDALMDYLYFDRPPGDEIPEQKIVDIYVCKVRAKIPESIGRIVTVWGRGYYWESKDPLN